MGDRRQEVLVIGAGVSGLTTAVCLAEAGLTVAVRAAQPPQRTTSAAAGAIWGPHLVGMDDRVARWAQVTLITLRQMRGDPATGIREISGVTCSRAAQDQPGPRPPEPQEPPRAAQDQPGPRPPEPQEPPPAQDQPGPRPPEPSPAPPAQGPPEWTDGVGERVRCEDAELPAGFTSGWRFTAPVISMPIYMDYLLARLADAGGSVQYDCLFASLAAAADQISAGVIVNCSGIGARDLVPDPDVLPVRGQAVVVANPGITEFFIGIGEEPGDLTYLFPHRDTVVMGGTEQPGDWNQQPDAGTAARILGKCAAIEPALRGAAVLAHKAGLRPTRPTVRLEAGETGDGRLLVHNYGHGGAGVTLSWGCALDVTRMVLKQRR